MGGADVIPGVSGGTMALIVGIYERLIEAVRTAASAPVALVRGDPAGAIACLRRVEWRFVLPLAAGILAAIAVGSAVLPPLLEAYPSQMSGLFFGLIAGSLAVLIARLALASHGWDDFVELLRWMFGWQNYIRDDHFDALGRLMIVVAIGWFYFFFLEFMIGIYANVEPELSLRQMQVFEWPFNFLFILFVLTAFFIPVPLWMFRSVRRNVALMFWTTIFVNIGMWLERFIIIIPGLMRQQPLTFNWGSYAPSIIEIGLVLGSFGLVFAGFFMFAKFFPIIPLVDAKEGRAFETEIQIGKVRVPAVYREE
jgi:uncharacterized membrane protein